MAEPMNAGEYLGWMKQAFLSVEGAMATELATAGRIGMTEDYLRGALLRGLLVSMPHHAAHVTREHMASWSGSPCIRNKKHVPSGRPIQHDVAVMQNNDDAGLVCEVKWLVQAQAARVAKDIWKLAISRTVEPEGSALRTYLLLAGESKAFSDTLTALRKVHINLRWSAAGPGNGVPKPTNLSLDKSLAYPLSCKPCEELITWGEGKHHRELPNTWASLRSSMRARWWRTVPSSAGGSIGWRLVLWELHHWGGADDSHVDWVGNRSFATTTAC